MTYVPGPQEVGIASTVKTTAAVVFGQEQLIAPVSSAFHVGCVRSWMAIALETRRLELRIEVLRSTGDEAMPYMQGCELDSSACIHVDTTATPSPAGRRAR